MLVVRCISCDLRLGFDCLVLDQWWVCHRIGRIQTVASKQSNTRTQVQEDTHTATIGESVGWSVVHSFIHSFIQSVRQSVSQSVSQSVNQTQKLTDPHIRDRHRQLTEKQSMRYLRLIHRQTRWIIHRYMYIITYVQTDTHTHTCLRARTHTLTHINARTCTHTHTRTHTPPPHPHTLTCVRVHTHWHIHARAHTRTQEHAPAHLNTTHASRGKSLWHWRDGRRTHTHGTRSRSQHSFRRAPGGGANQELK